SPSPGVSPSASRMYRGFDDKAPLLYPVYRGRPPILPRVRPGGRASPTARRGARRAGRTLTVPGREPPRPADAGADRGPPAGSRGPFATVGLSPATIDDRWRW